LHAIENIDQSHVSLLFGKPPPHGGDLLLASFPFSCRVVHCLSASGRSPFFMKNLVHRNGFRSIVAAAKRKATAQASMTQCLNQYSA
jgi:hypothetical protein